MKRNISGFTLIEVIVVAIIIGILAAVAVPTMRGYIDRAIKTEAITALGVIRNAERAYYAEYSALKRVTLGGSQSSDQRALGIAPADLDGTYFINMCYSVNEVNGIITCSPKFSRPPAPKYYVVNTWSNLYMNIYNGDTW